MEDRSGHDVEVNAAFQRTGGSLQPTITTTFVQANPIKALGGANTTSYIIEMDHSDDEESDHNQSDNFSSQVRGRVSPSPYTANTERARQFNAYVRGVIEKKLDIFIPISHQPRDVVSDIITDATMKFPEFESCVRKRIRTFLKSYRRSKKLKTGGSGSPQSHTNGVSKDDLMSIPGNQMPRNPVATEHPLPTNHINSRSSPLPHGMVGAPAINRSTAVVTIDRESVDDDDINDLPESKKMKMMTPTLSQSKRLVPGLAAGIPLSNSQSLSNSEVSAVTQLITGYRESAAFLQRAADQLEAMLHNNSSQ